MLRLGYALTALALEMHDLGRGHVIDFIARLPNAVKPVQILPVHKERLVQKSHALYDLPAHHHKRTRNRIHFGDLVGIQIRQVVSSEEAALREEAAESDDLEEGHARCGESPSARKLKRPVRIEDFASRRAGLRVTIHKIHHDAQRIPMHHGIRIQQEDVSPFTLHQGDIVPLGKSHVLLVDDQVDLRERGPHHLHTAIGGGIVHHEDFPIKPLQRSQRGSEGLL